ncbi:hypothetical protein ACH4SK_10975 [Streptomyces inhibens]|uniref:hypothetical protein n=1 Tax=Streptomyces inhibens TaxID=2293571 RepID=UPI003789E1E8
MATARSTNGMQRNRGSAVPFRLLWLAALLISVLVAHGARAESAEGHLVSAVPVAASSAAAADSGGWLAPEDSGHTEQPGHPGRGGHHSDELCVSAPPQQGAAVALPCVTPMAGSSRSAPVPGRSGVPVGASAALPPLRSTAGSVIQQV